MKILVAATGTDSLISLLYGYHQWVYGYIKEMRALNGQGLLTGALSILKISGTLEKDVISANQPFTH